MAEEKDAAHSTLGPSAAKRWMNCAGSVALVARLPKQRSGYAAAEGVVAHALHEEFHTGKIDGLELVARIGTVVVQEGHDVEVTEEMIDSAVNYHAAVEADVASLEERAAAKRSKDPARPGPKVVSLTEVKVKADKSIDERVWGTADKIVYRKGDTLIIRDLKFGKGLVEVEENEQMALYAIAVMDTEAGWAFEKVVLIIDQPRAPHEDGRERRWETTVEWLKAFAVKAKAAAARTLDPNAPVVPGPWCDSTYCAARAVCPALHKQAASSAMVAFSDPVPTLLPEQTKSIEKRAAAFMSMRLDEVRLMSDEQVLEAYKWKEPTTGFFDAVEEYLHERQLAGKPVPGTKLVNGRSMRAWVNPDEVAQKFGAVAWEKKLLSPAKLEAVVGKKAGVDEMTYKPEPKKLLVLSSDPREAARVSAQEAFAEPKPAAPAEIETTCPECDILGVCSRHDVQPGAVSAAPEKREPIWPV